MRVALGPEALLRIVIYLVAAAMFLLAFDGYCKGIVVNAEEEASEAQLRYLRKANGVRPTPAWEDYDPLGLAVKKHLRRVVRKIPEILIHRPKILG